MVAHLSKLMGLKKDILLNFGFIFDEDDNTYLLKLHSGPINETENYFICIKHIFEIEVPFNVQASYKRWICNQQPQK